MNPDYLQWAYAYGRPQAHGLFRCTAEDFVVDEDLGFEPDGSGEHLFLQVRKRGTNTDWLAQQLARWAGVKPSEVGFAGLKDRHAVTTQWFSIALPGRDDPDPEDFPLEEAQILAMARHSRKLRRGALSGNHFTLVVREFQGERGELLQRLEQIRTRGLPNYFGEQRFGHGFGNLDRAEGLFSGRLRERNRNKRGLYLSAARSLLFNMVLSARISAGNWDQPLVGEPLLLADSHAFFLPAALDETISQRLAQGDVLTSGPLWGRGRSAAQGDALRLESEVLEPMATFRDGLEHAGMQQERRPLRVPMDDLAWAFEDDSLRLAFSLPAGSYATALLRELLVAEEGNRGPQS